MRDKPVEVYPHSQGVKRFIFQDIIINIEKYYYCLLDGKMKTDLYNKGVLDGKKKPVYLYNFTGDFSKEIVKEKWLLAIPKDSILHEVDERKNAFVGRIGIVKTYLLKIDNIGNFLEYACSLGECPYDGQINCFEKNKFDCSKPNRERHKAGRYCYA